MSFGGSFSPRAVPASVLADLIGQLTGNRRLMTMGAKLMPVAAGSAVVTGVAGLIAQEAVKPKGRAHDMLATHRNLNLGLIGISLAMTAFRSHRAAPGFGYLAAGLGAVAAMNYSAYLGGKMVYEHGVGVKPADGLDEQRSPEIARGTLKEVAGKLRANLASSLRHTAEHLRRGQIVPTLSGHSEVRQFSEQPGARSSTSGVVPERKPLDETALSAHPRSATDEA